LVRAADVGVVNGSHKGSSFVFNFRNDLAIATTPLTELADVSPVAGSDTTASVTILEYGNVEVVSAKLRGTAYISETVRTANTMGYNGGLTFDTLARDPLLAGTNVVYLTLGYTPAPHTMFAGIEKLLPGENFGSVWTKILSERDCFVASERRRVTSRSASVRNRQK